MDSIGGMLNHIGKLPKTHYKKEFCNGFTGKKLMVYNGIVIETIGISVMVSIGLLLFLFFLAGHASVYFLYLYINIVNLIYFTQRVPFFLQISA